MRMALPLSSLGFFPGASGSSSTASTLAKDLGCACLSSGDMMRELAKAEGLTGEMGLKEFLEAS